VLPSTHVTYFASLMSPVASDFSILDRRESHLILDFKVDPKVAMRWGIQNDLACVITLSLIVVVLGIFMISNLAVLIGSIVPVGFIMLFIGLIFNLDRSRSRKWKALQAELDAISNKFSLFTLNTYPRRGLYAGACHYFTQAWDLDKITFRMVKSSELKGRKNGLLRISFKNQYFVALGTVDTSMAMIIFASENAELSRSLVKELENFIGGGNNHEDEQGGKLSSAEAS